MRGYAFGAAALVTFFFGLALWLSELSLRGLDLFIVALFWVGTLVAIYTYLKEPLIRVRRLAVVGIGLNGAALLLHAALLLGG